MPGNRLRLWWHPTSPYVRMVMVAAHELGLADDLELVTATPETVVEAVAAGESGHRRLIDSRVIIGYLNDLARGSLMPAGAARHSAMARHALAVGVIDSANLRRNLGLQPAGEIPQTYLRKLRDRGRRVLDALEDDAGALAGPVRIDRIAAGCALGYLDFRFADEDWRAGRPSLADWYTAFGQRPSMAATAPPGQ